MVFEFVTDQCFYCLSKEANNIFICIQCRCRVRRSLI